MISAMFALGIAVGCSQPDGAVATAVPGSLAPAIANGTVSDNLVVPAPTPLARAAADAREQPVVPARDRRTSPAGRGFVPLDDPTFLAADETEYFGDEELVLGLEFAGEVRAYPVRMLRYHHVINDTVGGGPLLVTY